MSISYIYKLLHFIIANLFIMKGRIFQAVFLSSDYWSATLEVKSKIVYSLFLRISWNINLEML